MTEREFEELLISILGEKGTISAETGLAVYATILDENFLNNVLDVKDLDFDPLNPLNARRLFKTLHPKVQQAFERKRGNKKLGNLSLEQVMELVEKYPDGVVSGLLSDPKDD